MIETPKWVELFTAILTRGQEALEWGLPEPWCHAELYRELKSREAESGWIPFPDEIPYVTCYSAKMTGSIVGNKWADLCLCTRAGDVWYWFELKARKKVADESLRTTRAEQADAALRDDIAALVGFDVQRTAQAWENNKSSSNHYSPHVKDYSRALLNSRQYFAAAFLQLDGADRIDDWKEQEFCKTVEVYLQKRKSESFNSSRPILAVENFIKKPIGGHSLILCQWHIEPSVT